MAAVNVPIRRARRGMRQTSTLTAPKSQAHIDTRAKVPERVARQSPARAECSDPGGTESRGAVAFVCGVVLVEGVINERSHLVVVVLIIDTDPEVGNAVAALYSARVLAQVEVDLALNPVCEG